jgi:bifunctional DNA-binding transcriptional regulator/antitoxin component of YhaV-PrlF toxin-antitoxin module
VRQGANDGVVIRVDYTAVARWIKTDILEAETIREGRSNRHRIKKAIIDKLETPQHSPLFAENHAVTYTVPPSMKEQERTFPLAEVHTKMGTMGEVQLNQTFLDVLGVKPGDFLIFTVSKEGQVTVSGEKNTTKQTGSSAPHPDIANVPHPDQVTQATLFSSDSPSTSTT